MRPAALFPAAIVLVAVAVGQSPTTAPVALAPQVERCLRYAPDDARLVVVVPSIDELARGIAAFGKTAGLSELAEWTARGLLDDVLGKNAAAVDAAGALVLAWCAECDEPLVITALGSEEPWRSTTQPTPLRENIRLYEFGPDRYMAASTGENAIFARDRVDLQRALDSSGKIAAGVTREGGDLLPHRQVVCYVDVGLCRDAIDPSLRRLGQMMAMGMTASGPDAEAAIQVWNWLFEYVRKSIAETQTCVAGARVDRQGLLLNTRIRFIPDSGAARYLRQVQRSHRDLLRGLPVGDAAILCAYEWEEGPEAEGFNAAFTRALCQMDSLKQKVGADRLETSIHRSLELNRKVPGSNLAVSCSAAEKGLLYCGLYLSTDGAGVQREMRAICETVPELLNAWGGLPSAKLTRQTEPVAGAEADVYLFSCEANDGSAASAIQPMVQAIYGKDPALLMAPHAEGVAFAFGPRERAREKLVELLQSKGPPLRTDERVAAALRQLTPDPQAFLLLDIPRVVKMAWTLVEQFGLPFPSLELDSQPTPLAGSALYLDVDAVRGEFYLPAEAVGAVVKPLEKFQDAADKAY